MRRAPACTTGAHAHPCLHLHGRAMPPRASLAVLLLVVGLGVAHAPTPTRAADASRLGPAKSIGWTHPHGAASIAAGAGAGADATPPSAMRIPSRAAGPAKAMHWMGVVEPRPAPTPATSATPVERDTRPEAGPAKAIHWMGRLPDR